VHDYKIRKPYKIQNRIVAYTLLWPQVRIIKIPHSSFTKAIGKSISCNMADCEVINEQTISSTKSEDDDIIVFQSVNNNTTDQSITREIICADACVWIQNLINKSKTLPGSVFTSLPDISEICHLFANCTVEERVLGYEKWFTDTAELIFTALPNNGYAIFLQSDVRVQSHEYDGSVHKWIDKSHLISAAAAKCNCTMMWHKISYNGNIDARSAGRPIYSHLLCYAKGTSYNSGKFSVPDIFPRGEMLWPKGIGINTCLMGVAFLKCVAGADTVVDPFCGYGTVLAMSNSLGLSAVGVEISNARCKKARSLDITSYLSDEKILSGRTASILGLPRSVQNELSVFNKIRADARHEAAKFTTFQMIQMFCIKIIFWTFLLLTVIFIIYFVSVHGDHIKFTHSPS